MITTTTERRALAERASTRVALRYAGGVEMAGTLQHDTGEMTWTTEVAAFEETDGTFAVVDGVLMVAYRHGDVDLLRIGTARFERGDVTATIEVGLSARELVLVTPVGTTRLRADGDPAAEAFAVELLADEPSVDLRDEPLAS